MTAGRPRSAEIDKALEAAALALFAEGGLAAVNFDQVARRAKLTRAAIYRRWKTREALVVSALQSFRAEAEAGLEDWSTRSLTEVLDLFVEHTVTVFGDPFQRSLLRQFVALGPEGAAIKQAYWSMIVEPRRDAFSQMIRSAQARGEIDPDLEPDLMQDLLAGALSYRLLIEPGDTLRFDARSFVVKVLKAVGLRR